MEGMYAEANVMRKNSMKDYAKIAGIIVATVLLDIIITKIIPIVGIVVLLVGAYLVYYFWVRTSVEYEYVFCDGQIDFDAIYSGAKRKNLFRTDLENAEIMAIEDDEEIKRFQKLDAVKNFSSNQDDIKPYALIVKKDGKLVKILFEPDDNMLGKIKYKMPRKIKLDKKIEF